MKHDLPTDWMDNANCRGEDPELFLPITRGVQSDSSPARLICAACVVREPCLQYALDNNEKGIWAETTIRDRRLIRKAGMTASYYLKGRENGTISLPKRNQPIKN